MYYGIVWVGLEDGPCHESSKSWGSTLVMCWSFEVNLWYE